MSSVDQKDMLTPRTLVCGFCGWKTTYRLKPPHMGRHAHDLQALHRCVCDGAVLKERPATRLEALKLWLRGDISP